MATTLFAVKTNAEIRDDMLRTYKSGLIARGVANPNLLPGSEDYARFQAIANELEPIYANQQTTLDQLMPDTTSGDQLTRWLAAFGRAKLSAQGSNGFIINDASQSTTIPAGSQLIDSSGQTFQTTVSGTYANGDQIAVSAITTGATTNHVAGDVLRWVSQPPYCNPTALVAVGGLVDGVGDEDDETARARLNDDLANPEQGGNWSQVANYAESSTASVQKAFVYPSVNGPSTVHVAVVGYTSATAKTRAVSGTLLTSTIQPYVSGRMLEGVEVTTTATTDVNEDISISVDIPSAPTASPPGPGGGWLNGSPWPTPYTAFTICDVTAVTSTTRFLVRALQSPTASVTKIVWLSPVDWKMYSATVTAVNNGSSPWDITIDTPFPNIAIGHYISPAATNSQTYFDAVLAAFAAMGPGEKTANAGALVHGYRHPIPSSSWPYKVAGNILKAVENSGDEVATSSYLYRLSNGAAPAVPGAITGNPKIYVPRNINILPSS